jgi:signal transduction histidine kinase
VRRRALGTRSIFHYGSPTLRASIAVPFLIIAGALLVLSYRSYQLSTRMERGLSALAVQYLGYSAEISSSRADSAVRDQLNAANADWRQVERNVGTVDFVALQQWVLRHPWIVSAIYIPDDEPEKAVFVAEPADPSDERDLMSNEFFATEGNVHYTYDAFRLLNVVRQSAVRLPEVYAPDLPEAEELLQQSDLALIRREELDRTRDASMSVSVPLSPPLDAYAIRASVHRQWIGTGWSRHRVITLWLSGIAFALVSIGMAFAFRGLRREAEAMHLRGALIANVSHELRTPLSMMRLGVETLKRKPDLAAGDRELMLDSMLREVFHLSHLVENVLDVARLGQGGKAPVFSPVNPVELVRSLVGTYDSWIRSKGFEIRLEIDETIGSQMWDREAVSRALLNLIDNAIKYSASEKLVTVILRRKGQWIELAVQDRGVGIRDEELDKIFDPYYRASFNDTESRRGAGLGLTLVQQIIAAHDGRIEVDSMHGIGSTFRLLFPAAGKEVVAMDDEKKTMAGYSASGGQR